MSKQALWYFCPVSLRKAKQWATIMTTRMSHAQMEPMRELCRKFKLNREATPYRNMRRPKSLRRSAT